VGQLHDRYVMVMIQSECIAQCCSSICDSVGFDHRIVHSLVRRSLRAFKLSIVYIVICFVIVYMVVCFIYFCLIL